MANCVARQFAGLSVSQPRSLGFKVAVAPNAARLAARSSNTAASRGRFQVMNARVANIELPNNKLIEYSLQSIYGIGPKIAKQILADANIDATRRTRDLSEDDLQLIRGEVEKYTIEGDLRRQIGLNIKRLKEINCYRGRRHYNNLPVRGQRTKTNARTRKGKAKTVAGKKVAKK